MGSINASMKNILVVPWSNTTSMLDFRKIFAVKLATALRHPRYQAIVFVGDPLRRTSTHKPKKDRTVLLSNRAFISLEFMIRNWPKIQFALRLVNHCMTEEALSTTAVVYSWTRTPTEFKRTFRVFLSRGFSVFLSGDWLGNSQAVIRCDRAIRKHGRWNRSRYHERWHWKSNINCTCIDLYNSIYINE